MCVGLLREAEERCCLVAGWNTRLQSRVCKVRQLTAAVGEAILGNQHAKEKPMVQMLMNSLLRTLRCGRLVHVLKLLNFRLDGFRRRAILPQLSFVAPDLRPKRLALDQEGSRLDE